MIVINDNQIQKNVLNELCSQLVKTRGKDGEELRQFVQNGCAKLKMKVCTDALNVPGVLMQCEPLNYDEDKECTIFVSQSVR